MQMYRHQLAPVAGEKSPFVSQRRKYSAAPTLLTMSTKIFEGNPKLADICKFAPITDFTIQIADLDLPLMRLARELNAPRSRALSTATWSPIENSILTTFTVRFGEKFTSKSGDRCNVLLDEEQKRQLDERVGQVVNLGFGDVAMEVAYSEYKKWEVSKGFRLDSLSLIFGGYSNSSYTPAVKTNSVFYLGRIVSGTTDFSVLRRFVEPGKFFPVYEQMLISIKFAAPNDNDDKDVKAMEEDDNDGDEDEDHDSDEDEDHGSDEEEDGFGW